MTLREAFKLSIMNRNGNMRGSMAVTRRLAAAAFALLVGGCTLQQQLLFALIPDGTIPMMLGNFESVDETNRRRIVEFEKGRDWDGLAKFAEGNINKEKSNHEWWIIAGYAYSQGGQRKRAIECYAEAVRLSPDDILGWNLLAQSYRTAGQSDRALQVATRALNVRSDSADTWFLVGETNSDLGRLEPATRAYGAAIQLDQSHAHAWLGLGKAYARLGRTDELKKVAETLRQLDPVLAKELAGFSGK